MSYRDKSSSITCIPVVTALKAIQYNAHNTQLIITKQLLYTSHKSLTIWFDKEQLFGTNTSISNTLASYVSFSFTKKFTVSYKDLTCLMNKKTMKEPRVMREILILLKSRRPYFNVKL